MMKGGAGSPDQYGDAGYDDGGYQGYQMQDLDDEGGDYDYMEGDGLFFS